MAAPSHRNRTNSSRRWQFEPLENRWMMAMGLGPAAQDLILPTTIEINSSGAIQVTGAPGDNSLTFSRSGSNFLVTDTWNDARRLVAVTGVSGATGDHTKQVSIPIATIEATGKPLQIVGGEGIDFFTFDLGSYFANLNHIISVNGGGELDKVQFLHTTDSYNWTIKGPAVEMVNVRNSLGKVDLSGIEFLYGGVGDDTFIVNNSVANGLINIDGDGGVNEIRVARDANVSLGDRGITVTPFNTSQVPQYFSFDHIQKATLTGGPGNNFFDANKFTGSVKMSGGAGNDILWGGAGNDTLDGGPGNDFLGGGPGDDVLNGDDGYDVIIGGDGADKINITSTSGLGQDILIGGRTTYGFQKSMVDAVMGAWSGTGTYSERIKLLSVTGVGANKQFKLNKTTVLDDAAIDLVYGREALDWFFLSNSKTTGDKRDVAAGEQVVVIG